MAIGRSVSRATESPGENARSAGGIVSAGSDGVADLRLPTAGARRRVPVADLSRSLPGLPIDAHFTCLTDHDDGLCGPYYVLWQYARSVGKVARNARQMS